MITESYFYKHIGNNVYQIIDAYSNEVVCHCLPNENRIDPEKRAENISYSLNMISSIRARK